MTPLALLQSEARPPRSAHREDAQRRSIVRTVSLPSPPIESGMLVDIPRTQPPARSCTATPLSKLIALAFALHRVADAQCRSCGPTLHDPFLKFRFSSTAQPARLWCTRFQLVTEPSRTFCASTMDSSMEINLRSPLSVCFYDAGA
jgi:hypothetical protein